MKKLMCLGGNYFQMTAVKAAKRLGYHVIDVDYLPENPAHKFADEYYNISTLDKKNVLQLAKEKEIDGIISYASDVSALTASYVAEQMGLPANPYETVKVMTRKDLFHPFLRDNGFFVPDVSSVQSVEDVYDFYDKYSDIILKPVNSSGSKGVTRITQKSQVVQAFQYAKEYSRDTVLIAEQFVEREGMQVAGDAFVVNGEIRYFGIANEHFDCDSSPLVPIGESFPSGLAEEKAERARREIQKAIELLGFKTGPINLDFMFDKRGNVFIIELGPRSGGNLISDAICLGSDIDLAAYAVKAAVGEDLSQIEEKPFHDFVASYIFHSLEDGVFRGLNISKEMQEKLVSYDFFVQPGQSIYRYINGAYGIGAALLKFSSYEEMMYMMENMNEFYDVLTE